MKDTNVIFRINKEYKKELQEKAKNENLTLTKLIFNKLQKNDSN